MVNQTNSCYALNQMSKFNEIDSKRIHLKHLPLSISVSRLAVASVIFDFQPRMQLYLLMTFTAILNAKYFWSNEKKIGAISKTTYHNFYITKLQRHLLWLTHDNHDDDDEAVQMRINKKRNRARAYWKSSNNRNKFHTLLLTI